MVKGSVVDYSVAGLIPTGAPEVLCLRQTQWVKTPIDLSRISPIVSKAPERADSLSNPAQWYSLHSPLHKASSADPLSSSGQHSNCIHSQEHKHIHYSGPSVTARGTGEFTCSLPLNLSLPGIIKPYILSHTIYSKAKQLHNGH